MFHSYIDVCIYIVTGACAVNMYIYPGRNKKLEYKYRQREREREAYYSVRLFCFAFPDC